MRSDFGFIIHPVDVNLIPPAFAETKLYAKRPELLEKIFEWLPPFKCSHVSGVRSKTGDETEGDLIYVPYLPQQIMSLPSQVVLDRVIEAGRVAKKLGSRILGLGAYAAFVGRRGVQIQEALDMPVTTGSAYTVGSAIRASSWVAEEIFGHREMIVAVIGATGGLGGAIARILASKVRRMALVGRQQTRLKMLEEDLLRAHASLQIRVFNQVEEAVKHANLIFVSTNSPDLKIDVRSLMPGTVICDISVPHNVDEASAAMRKDVLVVDGGVIRPPGDCRLNFYFGLPEGLAFACMAETMILALENRFESYSLGGNLTAEKVDEILGWGDRHGFRLAEPRSFGKTITPADIKRVRESVN